jgi:hypothetical protein
MGAAPEILQTADVTPEEARESERQWFLDTDTGELKPDGDAGGVDDDPGSLPKPVRVARWIFD